MGFESAEREALVAQAAMVFSNDTVLAALRLMQEHGVQVLPVVDERDGELLGEVRDEELYRLWSRAPLARMDEVLQARRRAMRVLARQAHGGGAERGAAEEWVH